MFLVIYYQRYVGFFFDEQTQGFFNKEEAEAYAKKAKRRSCKKVGV